MRNFIKAQDKSNAPYFSHRRTAATFVAVAVVSSLALAGCSPGTPAPEGTVAAKIALVAGAPNVFFDPWEESGKIAETEHDVNQVDFVVPPTQTYETAVQITTLNGLVAQGYNGMGIFPNGAEAIRPTYARIAGTGVVIVDITGCSKQPTAALFCIATDVEAAAMAQTELVIKKMGGKGNIVFLAGEPTDPNTMQRVAGVEKAIAATNGAVKLLQVVAGIDSPTAALPAIQSLLASKASEIDGIVSTSYYPSLAGAELWSNNPEYQRIVFAAADASPEVMSAIKSGAIYGSMFQDPLGQGIIAAYVLNEIITKGCTVRDDAPWTKSSLTDQLMATGTKFIDKTSVDQYIGKPYGLPDETAKLFDRLPEFLKCR